MTLYLGAHRFSFKTIFYNQLPHTILSFFSKNQSRRLTRQTLYNLSVVQRSTKIQNGRPSVYGPFHWNALPLDVRSVDGPALFATKIKNNFLNLYWLSRPASVASSWWPCGFVLWTSRGSGARDLLLVGLGPLHFAFFYIMYVTVLLFLLLLFCIFFFFEYAVAH